MIKRQILDRLKKIPGRWHVNQDGAIRHKSLFDAEGRMACPLVALYQTETGENLENWQINTARKWDEFIWPDLSDEETNEFMEAADGRLECDNPTVVQLHEALS